MIDWIFFIVYAEVMAWMHVIVVKLHAHKIDVVIILTPEAVDIIGV